MPRSGIVPAADAVDVPRQRARRSTTRSCRRSAIARRSPITTSPRSSTSCRRPSAQPAGAWIHYGLTSQRRRRHRVVLGAARRRRPADRGVDRAARRRVVDLARAHRDTVMIGRTHGIHAEPTTFGAKVALWALQVDRDRSRLRAARRRDRGVQAQRRRRHVLQHRSVGRGASSVERLGLTPVPATQVIARDRHAEYL